MDDRHADGGPLDWLENGIEWFYVRPAMWFVFCLALTAAMAGLMVVLSATSHQVPPMIGP